MDRGISELPRAGRPLLTGPGCSVGLRVSRGRCRGSDPRGKENVVLPLYNRVTQNGNVLAGRSVMPFNSPGGSAGTPTDLLASSALNVVTVLFGWFEEFFYLFWSCCFPPPSNCSHCFHLSAWNCFCNAFSSGRNDWHNPYCCHHHQSLHS